MLLKKIINKVPLHISNKNIKGLALDSRLVKKDFIFFALKGQKYNGDRFISSALKMGASLIITEKKINNNNTNKKILFVKDVKKTLTEACVNFYKTKPKNIIAVTGTNGKSSVAEFYFQLLKLQKKPVATIGTLGIKTNKKLKKTNLTSLDIITLHKELFDIKKSGIDNVILEASSHGLLQGRLTGINFKTSIFTNLSQDHLDYHKNMNAYLNAKLILFSKLMKKKTNVIIRNDIKEFNKIRKISLKRKLNLVPVGKNSDFSFKIIQNLEKSQLVEFSFKKKKFTIEVPLIGYFQIKNLMMSILAAKYSGFKLEKILKALKNIKPVDGRLELIRVLPNQTKVFVDYAHTPDALQSALTALKNHFEIKPSLVFGCGGNRDKNKRSKMAVISEKIANNIYVTDDNPRTENPSLIRKMILKGFRKKNRVYEVPDRMHAIKQSIITSDYRDVVLIAGKGHEDTQQYANRIIKISDKKIINQIKLKKIKNFNKGFNSELIKKISFNKKFKNYFFEGVSINSKEIKPGNLFIAIKGKNHDGHLFIRESINKGASFCVSEKSIKEVHQSKIIKYRNSFKFLNELAVQKREKTKAKIIAITGSSGKTTLKNYIANSLSLYGKTYFSSKSYNNHYGVPLSICNLESYHRYGVFEVGMSHSGEIRALSKLIKPDIGIITNIGEAHIENFKNLKEIAKAKSEIIENIKEGGILILNRDDNFFDYISKIAKKKNLRVLSFSLFKDASSKILKITNKKNFSNITIKIFNQKYSLKIEKYNDLKAYNILASLLVAKVLNLNISKINFNSNIFDSVTGRGKVHLIRRFKKKFNLVDESYNANPSSTKKAISNFSKINNKNYKKYFLFGDMLELGKKSGIYHKKLSKDINQSSIDKLFIYGKNTFKTYQETNKEKRGNILQNLSDFDEVFSKILNNNDYLMIKGSNATGLNKLTNSLIRGDRNAL